MKKPYSPSPWYSKGGFIGTDEEDIQTIAYLSDHRNSRLRPNTESESNGLLIAAAPELLEALENLLIKLDQLSTDDWRLLGLTEVTIAKAVIAKVISP